MHFLTCKGFMSVLLYLQFKTFGFGPSGNKDIPGWVFVIQGLWGDDGNCAEEGELPWQM